jgi:endo-1,4-beta-xylanase
MGADYVRVAAEAARKANPNVKIWLNDFGAENDTGSRWQAMFQTIKSWKQVGIPIYGVGFQSHIYDTSTDLIVDKNGQALNLRKNIQDLASIGVMSRISELDAPVNGEYDGSSQSRQFVGVLKTCIELPSCKAVSFWSIGPTDRYQNDEHRLQPVETDSLFGPTMIPAQSYEDLQEFLR